MLAAAAMMAMASVHALALAAAVRAEQSAEQWGVFELNFSAPGPATDPNFNPFTQVNFSATWVLDVEASFSARGEDGGARRAAVTHPRREAPETPGAPPGSPNTRRDVPPGFDLAAVATGTGTAAAPSTGHPAPLVALDFGSGDATHVINTGTSNRSAPAAQVSHVSPVSAAQSKYGDFPLEC